MKRKNKKKSAGIIFGLALVIFVGALAGALVIKYRETRSLGQYEELKQEVDNGLDVFVKGESKAVVGNQEIVLAEQKPKQEIEKIEAEDVREENSIDFNELKKINADVYAWITVPGTKVDYPVVHAAKNDITYLQHDLYRKPSAEGVIYTDGWNSGDFSDRNTLIYGHNMKNGSMFAGLKAFRDSEFFEQHDTITIHIEGKTLTYKIFAAYTTGDEHILAEKDFTKGEVFDKYIEDIFENRDLSAHLRKLKITEADKIVTLCTCVDQDNKRFFIQGVLQK